MPADELSLRVVAALLDITASRLWLDCTALGGNVVTIKDVTAALTEDSVPLAPAAREIVRQALDERAFELGLPAPFGLPISRSAGVRQSSAESRRRARALRARARTARCTSVRLATCSAQLLQGA
jgi:hypothetical protein